MAYRAFIEDYSFVSTVVAGIHRMIDGAVADALVVHDLYDLRNGTYILLSFPVQFHIRNVPAAGNGVERRFAPDLFGDADRFLHIHMEGIDVVIAVRHAGDFAVFPAVYLGETSRKSFGRCGKYGIIQVIFLFIFVYHFVHFHYSFVQRVPCLLAVSVTFSVKCHHCIVSADKADAQRTAA